MHKLVICLFFSALLPIAAYASDAEDSYLVDSIFGLRDVQDMEIDTGKKRLLVTLSDTVLYFDMFPLKLIQEMPLDMTAASGSLSARGNLFVVGELPSGLSSEGPVGVLQVFTDFVNETQSEVDVDIDLNTTPISEAFFNGSGEFFAVGPTRYSVLNISEQEFMEGLDTGWIILNDLLLQCGTSAQFSVFDYAGEIYYVSSVNGSKVIEYGSVDPTGSASGDVDCFNPNRLLASKGALNSAGLNFSPVRHAIVSSRPFVDDDELIDQGILTFDVDKRALAFFPLEYFDEVISIVRSDSVQKELDAELGPPNNSSDFGLLASDDDADIILLSYFGSTVVHRLSWRDSEFVYLGRFETDQPIKSLYITPLGDFAAIVSGNVNRGGREELTVIQWPGRIPPFEELGAERFSVTALQRELGETGVSDLEADGIFGTQTRRALDSYLEQQTVTAAPSNSGITTSISEQKPVTPELENALKQTIKGLFPLQPQEK